VCKRERKEERTNGNALVVVPSEPLVPVTESNGLSGRSPASSCTGGAEESEKAQKRRSRGKRTDDNTNDDEDDEASHLDHRRNDFSLTEAVQGSKSAHRRKGEQGRERINAQSHRQQVDEENNGESDGDDDRWCDVCPVRDHDSRR
jgi:hypothetical protein